MGRPRDDDGRPPLEGDDLRLSHSRRPKPDSLKSCGCPAWRSESRRTLALGRHADLVGELEVLTERHPYRERLSGRLIDYRREDFADGQHRYDVILDIGGNRRLSQLRRRQTP
jgi:hypothetical protein